MASSGERETGESTWSGHAGELNYDSYTAHRLQHATPEHLHLTTRRCFIGPIPQDWLSKHRKSWYKYRPHFSTYSSRSATFDAGHNIDRRRSVTGLDGSSRSGHTLLPSFPQPADVDQPAQAEGDIASIHSDISTEALSLEPVPVSQDPIKTKRVSFGDVQDRPTSKQNRREPRVLSRVRNGSSKTLKSSGTSSAGETFVTARETIVSRIEDDSTKPGDSSNSTSSLLRRASGDFDGSHSAPSPPLPMEHSYHSYGRESSELARSVASKNNALNDKVDNSSKDEITNSKEQLAAEAAAGLRNVEPISTGLVRFAVPDQPENPDVQVDGRKRRRIRDLLRPEPEPGELIKAERMLVRVDWTKQDLPSGYNENDSIKSDYKPVDKWREFIVVCRKATEDTDGEYVLQMTKTRVITSHDRKHTRKKVAHEISLVKSKTKINMFSSLDKTIVLWTPWKNGTRTYILRGSSAASSVEWLTFLNTALGWRRADQLSVHVPDFNLTISLTRPFQALEVAEEKALEAEDDTQVSLSHIGEGVVARDIVQRCVNMLKQSAVSGAVDTWFKQDFKIGLAWKRYDRLEWVHGANEARMYGTIAMQQSYDLELRPKQHYPTDAASLKNKNSRLQEPAPIEGFLVRMTSQKGQHTRLGKTFFKRLYFQTHNQFLCFSLPSKAMPPKPQKMPTASNDQVPTASELVEKVPMIFAVNPYPLNGEQISWLDEQTSANIKKEMDLYAYEESDRKIKNLLDTHGYINMIHIVRVRKMQQGSAAPTESGNNQSPHDSAEDLSEDDEQTQPADQIDAERSFEITLRNGLLVRLQAYDKLARKEWVKRLRKLVKYWKARVTQDMNLYKDVRQRNLEKLEVDEEMESIMGQFAQKWEVSKSFASPELFNMCGISCCRAITMAGTLYRKPRLHSTFQRCSVILCHGKLLIFQSTLRDHSGTEIPHIHHERQEVVDLKDTYIYSGLITDNDLLYQNKTFDSNRPGHHSLPRVYLEDNWTSTDEDTMTCFVVWHGRSKSWFKANSQQDDGRIKQNLRYVSSLGRPGRSMVFKCRSRAERDHWVMNINMEIERLQQAGDIRIVSK